MTNIFAQFQTVQGGRLPFTHPLFSEKGNFRKSSSFCKSNRNVSIFLSAGEWHRHPNNGVPLQDELITAGGDHTIALKADGSLWTWGRHDDGQLGRGTIPSPSYYDYPGKALFASTPPIRTNAVAAGGLHSIILKSDGTVRCWGSNEIGQLGNTTFGGKNIFHDDVPVQQLVSYTTTATVDLKDIIALAGGIYHTIALKTDGTVWTWGSNGFGQLGNSLVTNSSVAVPVLIDNEGNFLTHIIDIGAGGLHNYAVTDDGHLYVWGDNSGYQLGISAFTTSQYE